MGSIMEKLLHKVDQSPNPELEREIAKGVAGMGFAGTVFPNSLTSRFDLVDIE